MNNFYERYNFAVKIILSVSLIIGCLFVITYKLINSQINEYQNDEVVNFINLIKHEMSYVEKTNRNIERKVEENLFFISEKINTELNKYPLEKLNNQILQNYIEEFNLTGISIFADVDNKITIINSTIPQEIGISTENWGYWNDAFRELLNQKTVSNNKGYFKKNYWAGPRTLSYITEGFHKYTYYYNQKNNFLLNLIVTDPYIFNYEPSPKKEKNSIDETLFQFQNNLDFISTVAIIDNNAFISFINGDTVKKGYDPLIIHGDRTLIFPMEIMIRIKDYLSQKNMANTFFDTEDKASTIGIVPIENNKSIIMLLNHSSKNLLFKKTAPLFIIMGVASILSIFAISYLMIQNYQGLLDIEKERLQIAEDFKKTISVLPDIIYHCKFDKNGEIYLTSVEGKILKNEKFRFLKNTPIRLKDIFPPEIIDANSKYFKSAFAEHKERFEMEYLNRVFEHVITPVYKSGINLKTAKVNEIMGVANDITERVQEEQMAKYMAYHDTLTNLPNRAKFMSMLDDLIKQHEITNEKFTLFYMDLDNFKLVNDHDGHQIGDILLRKFGYRVNDILSNDETLCRIGGDEFAVISKENTLNNIIKIAENIIESTIQPFEIQQKIHQIGVSIGVAIYPEHGATKKELIKNADDLMYQIKKEGKKGFKIYKN